MRTNQAIVEDYAAVAEGFTITNGERRGIPPNQLLPEPSQVEGASTTQLADVKAMAVTALEEVLAERRNGTG